MKSKIINAVVISILFVLYAKVYIDNYWANTNLEIAADTCEFTCSVDIDSHMLDRTVSVYVNEKIDDMDYLANKVYYQLLSNDMFLITRNKPVTINVYDNDTYQLVMTKRYER